MITSVMITVGGWNVEKGNNENYFCDRKGRCREIPSCNLFGFKFKIVYVVINRET